MCLLQMRLLLGFGLVPLVAGVNQRCDAAGHPADQGRFWSDNNHAKCKEGAPTLVYNPSQAAATCRGATCSVASDQATCCIAPLTCDDETNGAAKAGAVWGTAECDTAAGHGAEDTGGNAVTTGKYDEAKSKAKCLGGVTTCDKTKSADRLACCTWVTYDACGKDSGSYWTANSNAKCKEGTGNAAKIFDPQKQDKLCATSPCTSADIDTCCAAPVTCGDTTPTDTTQWTATQCLDGGLYDPNKAAAKCLGGVGKCDATNAVDRASCCKWPTCALTDAAALATPFVVGGCTGTGVVAKLTTTPCWHDDMTITDGACDATTCCEFACNNIGGLSSTPSNQQMCNKGRRVPDTAKLATLYTGSYTLATDTCCEQNDGAKCSTISSGFCKAGKHYDIAQADKLCFGSLSSVGQPCSPLAEPAHSVDDKTCCTANLGCRRFLWT